MQNNIYVYLYNTYGDKWSTKNFNITDVQAEGLFVGSIELIIDGRSIVGSATTIKDFSLDVSQDLKVKCITDALSCIPAPIKQYTQQQLEAISIFKQKHNIDSNDKLNSYINTWKQGMTVNNLTPDNIDEFINYINGLENA